MQEQFSKYSRGVSLIEILLALALFSVVFAAVLNTQWQIGELFINVKKILLATQISNSNLLNILNNQTDGLIGTESFGLLGIESGVSMQPFSRCQSVANSRSTWRTGWRSTSTVYTSLLTMDLTLLDKYGADCGGQPEVFSVAHFNLTHSINLGYPATSVDLIRGSAYVALRPNSESAPDLARVSIQREPEVSLLHFGIGTNKVDAVSGHVFAAQHSTSSQLVLVDTSQGNDLFITASSSLPNVAGARPEAVSMYYFDSKIYVGTKRTAGHEFHVYDVSNPDALQWLGSKEVNHNINDIVVKEGLAFLATSGNIRDLIVLDIRNPSAIVQLAAIDLLGNEDGRSIFVAGDLIFLGRYKSTVPGRPELYVLKFHSDSGGSPLEISVVDSVPTNADVNGIVLAGGYVFVATNNLENELQVFILSRDNQLTAEGVINLPAAVTGIDFENEIFAVTSGNMLYVFTQEQHE